MTRTSTFKYRIIRSDGFHNYKAQKRVLGRFWLTIKSTDYEYRARQAIDDDRDGRLVWTGD